MSHIDTLIISKLYDNKIIDLYTTDEYSDSVNVVYLESYINSFPLELSAIELTNRISAWSDKILQLDIKDLDNNIILSTLLDKHH